MSRALKDRRIHVERRKRWGTLSVFLAEWFASSVAYCQTPEGKKQFEEWMQEQYREQTPQILALCYAGPRRRYGTSTGNVDMFNKAAYELGVSDLALQEYYRFSAEKEVAIPVRTLPAPVKKRGEASSAWLARCGEETLKGAKIPNVNWDELRRIAFSEFDAICDEIAAWRLQPALYFKSLEERANSTIISPNLGLPESMRASQARTDAMRSRLHILHLQYAAWSQASSLFEYLDKIGRKTPSSVMAALKQDSSLLGHMAGVVLACKELQKWLGGKLDQLLTSSEYLKPFFIRRRDENGSAAIHPNLANPEARNPKDGTIELVLTSLLREGGPESNPSTLLRALWPVLQKHTEASKITADAFDCLGDFGIVSEFVGGLVDTTFGKELKQLVAEANKSGASKSWFTTLCAIPESKLQRLPPTPRFDLYGELDAIVASQANQWLEVVFSLDGRPGLDTIIATNELVPHYDHLWMYIDSTLWEAAEQLEGTPGSLKDMYGLVNPDHEERPRYSREFLKEFYRVEHERKESAPTPAPAAQPSESSIPVAIPGQDEVARAPPRPTEAPKTKRKGKGKKKKAPRPSPNDAAEPPEDKEADEDHPFIPNLSKLSHKTIEIFQRLLSHEEKSGQIRWGDFEKAMAQAGFDVIQTEGSSVRFDPLVGDARPISFHRPHPDSTLSPVLIRWTGARLKRRYGWTASTFSTESANVDTAAEAE